MLSRPGSTTSSNLQRTKSTTSVQDRRKHPLQAKPIDPQTARTHALIAAHRAVDRSRSSASTEIERSESILSTRSLLSRHEQSVSFSPATHLKRQRSTLQNRVPRLADTLQLPGKHSGTIQSQGQDDSNYETLFGISGENYGAEPSSYRKLRRSRSSLSPVRRCNYGSDGLTDRSLSQAPTLRTIRSQAILQSPGFKLRLKRSLNFLRSNHTTTDRVPTAPANFHYSTPCSPEAIALARNQYLEGPGQQQVTQNPSVLYSKVKRAEKVFRKSTRGPEQDTSGLQRIESTGNLASIIQERRSLSASLSDKVKKIFGRSKQEDCIPPQQLQASKAHFGMGTLESSPDAGFDSYLVTNTPSTKRSSLYVPGNSHPETCDDIVGISQYLSPSNSCQSLNSQSKSRVTSWTDSTVNGSVSLQPGVIEQQRLSIIKEDGGPHQPSCSAGRHIGGVAAFQRPLSIPEGQAVDSQQVYSALLKRIDEEQKEMEKTQAALKEIHDAQDQNEIVGHYLFSAPTIRKVQSKESLSHTEAQGTKPDDRTKLPSQIKARTMSSSESLRPILKSDVSQQPTHSTLLPSSNHHEAKGRSPFRQYLDNKKSEVSLRDSQHLLNETSNAASQSNDAVGRIIYGKFSQSTDSIYSRTTNGGINPDYVRPLLSTENLSAEAVPRADMATVMHLYESVDERLLSSSGAQASEAHPAKGPWQGWMDRQMDKVGPTRAGMSSSGHLREHAQIDPNDTTVGRNTHDLQPHQASAGHADRTLRASLLTCPSVDSLGQARVARGWRKSPSPFLQLKEVSQKHTSAPTQTISMRKSQSALLDQTNKEEETANGRAPGLRKSSPSSITLMLKGRRSQPVLTKRSTPGKENNPMDDRDTSPLSTPGRYRPTTRNGDNIHQLRKGRSAIDLQHRKNTLDDNQYSGLQKYSPTNTLKSTLSARLSRPFDMDIPERNRPFDSIYLGKRETGNGSRLSVATNSIIKRQPKTYGDLGPPAADRDRSTGKVDEKESEATALPTLLEAKDAERSVSGRSFSLAGKRIVSNFLKSRFKHGHETKASPGETSAFI